MGATRRSTRDLFEAALDVPAPGRAEWLEAHCSDPAQRAEIERLLAADLTGEADDALIDGSLDDLLERVVAEQPLPGPGAQVGPWRLLEPLGEGGSSIVFRAAREQHGVEQTVALKLLRHGLLTEDERRRFRDERRALAQLSHPGIARLVEGGLTEAGMPYIAIELVEGEPVTDYVRKRRLGLRARLLLFVSVCRAVEAAHRALIVHRDLKPSNVLVTREGEARLLDFGIAKLLHAPGEDATHTQRVAMTPAYAAPEQFNHGPITTATDVYALGVLLDELVTGERRAQGDARTPSARISAEAPEGSLPGPPKATRRQLRGDLDNIVLKATAEEPERRYASAGALAEDIERHLAAQPVGAHPPSTWYRTRKFVTRHRGGVVTTAALVLAVFAALGIALWQANVARAQARQARDQAQRAAAVRDLLVDLFDAPIPSGPRDALPDTAELLARGTRHALEDLGGTPAVQSELLVALGRVYDHLSNAEQGERVLDAALVAARKVQPPDPALLGAALSERGELDVSRSRYPEALDLLGQAVALQEKAVPGSLALALTLDRRALAESQTGAHEAALGDYRAALAIRERLLPAGDPERINSIAAIGSALSRAGRPLEALPLQQQAVEAARATFGEQHVKTAHYMKNTATSLLALRRYAEAADLAARAVAIERTLYPPGSPDVVNGLNNLGTMDLVLGRLHASRDALSEARATFHAAGLDQSMGQTFVLGNLARAEALLGNRAQALALLDEAIATSHVVFGPDHARTVSLEVQRMHLQLVAGVDAAAARAMVPRLQQVLADAGSLGQFRARTEGEARLALGLALAAAGDEPGAGSALQAAVAALPHDPVDPFLLPAVPALAHWQRTHGETAAAQSLLVAWIGHATRDLPPTHPAVGELHLAAAELLQASDPSATTRHATAARAAFAELPPEHPWMRRLAAVEAARAAP
jgi:serine/threonine-protein kinase